MAAAYRIQGDSFVPEKVRQWSSRVIQLLGTSFNFDVASDGKRVVALPALAEEKGSVHVTFLLNYFDELRRRLPPK